MSLSSGEGCKIQGVNSAQDLLRPTPLPKPCNLALQKVEETENSPLASHHLSSLHQAIEDYPSYKATRKIFIKLHFQMKIMKPREPK